MTQFDFKCPHCGETSQVLREELGLVALCTACGKPYQALVPAGAMLGAGTNADGVAPTDEQAIVTVNPAAFREHPIQTGVCVVLILAGLTGLFLYSGDDVEGLGFAILRALSALAVAGAAIGLVVRFVLTRFESLTITNQRSIWARGIINRRSSEVQHDDIRNIQVEQNLIERFVKVGTIAISSAGQHDMEITVHGISKPHKVVDTIRTYQSRMVKPD